MSRPESLRPALRADAHRPGARSPRPLFARLLPLLFTLLFTSLCTLLFGAPAALAQVLLDTRSPGEVMVEGIAAQVGGEIILASEVLELTSGIEVRMREAGAPPEEILRIRRDALENLIEGRLLSSVVERLELSADREEIDGAIAAIAGENGLSVEQLLASIRSHGLSEEEYRAKIRDELERSKVVNAMVRSRIQISKEEVRALYQEKFGDQRTGGEEVQLRHILVMTEGPAKRSASEACAIAREARKEIVGQGAEFSEVAGRVSDMEPQRGGNLGWMHKKDLAGWMSKTVRDLEPGEVSPVVEMPFGCNLLQVVDRRSFQPISFEQAEVQLQNELFARKTEVEYTKWLDVLRSQIYIERKGAFAASSGLGG